MSVPPITNPDLVDVIDAAAQEGAKDRNELNLITRHLIAYLVRFIVSIVARPLRGVVHVLVAERVDAMRAALIIEIRNDIEAEVKAAYDDKLAAAIADIDRKVAAAVAAQRAGLRTYVTAQVASNNREVRYVSPIYPFAYIFALIGAVVGGFGSWWLTRNFEHSTVIDEAGQNWIATTIAGDPVYATIFIAVCTCLVAAVGAVIGWIIDTIRNHRSAN